MVLEFHVFAIIKTDNNPQLETPLYGVLLVKHVKKKKNNSSSKIYLNKDNSETEYN